MVDSGLFLRIRSRRESSPSIVLLSPLIFAPHFCLCLILSLYECNSGSVVKSKPGGKNMGKGSIIPDPDSQTQTQTHRPRPTDPDTQTQRLHQSTSSTSTRKHFRSSPCSWRRCTLSFIMVFGSLNARRFCL